MKITTLLLLSVCSALSAFGGFAETPKVPSAKAIRDAGVLKEGPFKGVDPGKYPIENARLILAANYDFQKLLNGGLPALQ